MSNMSYCRFENTLLALRDCAAHACDNRLSQNERVARRQLLQLCREMLLLAEGPETSHCEACGEMCLASTMLKGVGECCVEELEDCFVQKGADGTFRIITESGRVIVDDIKTRVEADRVLEAL